MHFPQPVQVSALTKTAPVSSLIDSALTGHASTHGYSWHWAQKCGNSTPGTSIKTLILEASGHMRFSWKSEQAISHFLQPLHLDSSLAIQIGSFLVVNFKPSVKSCETFLDTL